MTKVEVIIPTYRPGKEFAELLSRLEKQTLRPWRVQVVNTEEGYWDKKLEKAFPGLAVRHVEKKSFNHGKVRADAARESQADILLFMTQDALPANTKLVETLVSRLGSDPRIGAAYARQLPRTDCRKLERFYRRFNYPDHSEVRSEEDGPRLGIRTYFCSNVCAAYDRAIYREVGGFPSPAIFNEDMIYTGHMLQKGYRVAYEAEARVIHSHNYSLSQQFRRNFDLAVSQAEHPEIFQRFSSEKEGLRMLRQVSASLLSEGSLGEVGYLLLQSASKYAGYFMGKRYRKLPKRLIPCCSASPEYWET